MKGKDGRNVTPAFLEYNPYYFRWIHQQGNHEHKPQYNHDHAVEAGVGEITLFEEKGGISNLVKPKVVRMIGLTKLLKQLELRTCDMIITIARVTVRTNRSIDDTDMI